MAEIKIQSFLILEQTLTKRLVATWRKFSSGLITRIQKAIQREDWTRVELLIDEINFSRVLSSNKRFMEFIGRGAFLFGVARHDELSQSKFVKDKEPIPFLTDASENLQKIIAQQGDVFVKRNIRRAVATIKERLEAEKITKSETTSDAILILKERVKKAAKVRSNAQLLSNAVNGRTDQYLENVSSLHNSRLAGWGYVQEAEALGITTYRVSEQIDSDTICPICISMHGKEFTTQEAKQRLGGLLTVDNLNDLQQIAPFPNQSKAGVQSFRNLNNSELVSNGWHVPPYHPRCRGLLVRSTDSANLGPLPIQARRRIPKPAPLPPISRVPKLIPGLDKIDSDEVRRLFPSLINSPAKARQALTKKRTTDMFTDALKRGDQKVLAGQLRGRSPVVARSIEADFKFNANDPDLIKTINTISDNYADANMNPAVLRNRPLNTLIVGEDARRVRFGVQGQYDVALRGEAVDSMFVPFPLAERNIWLRDPKKIGTMRHETGHHFDGMYAEAINGTDLTVGKPIPLRTFDNMQPKLARSIQGVQEEFKLATVNAENLIKNKLGPTFEYDFRSPFHAELIETEGVAAMKSITPYSLVNDREWIAEATDMYYSGKTGRKLLKKTIPKTFAHLDELNKGGFLKEADIVLQGAP